MAKKVWEFEPKDMKVIESLLKIMTNHVTLHDLTVTQAYEFHKILDAGILLPKILRECPEVSTPLVTEEKIEQALALLEEHDYTCVKAKVKTPIKLGPGGK